MSDTKVREGQLLIPNARIGYPTLFKPEGIKGQADSRPRYSCNIYLSKEDELTKAKINEITSTIIKEKMKGVKPKSKDLCIVDGDGDDGDENTKGYWVISANRQESQGRPQVIDKNRSPLTQEDAKIYAGCRCNFLVDFYKPKDWNKIACGLEIVQFKDDDEPFGAARPDANVMPDESASQAEESFDV